MFVTLMTWLTHFCRSGSGIVTAFVGSLLAPLGAGVYGSLAMTVNVLLTCTALFTTDINLKACQGTLSTAQANNVRDICPSLAPLHG